ncbi:MAG: DUF2075 domain-containing protein [Demequina sp.]|nr:DUF2075 domain-containing protein [Demequina sp.]
MATPGALPESRLPQARIERHPFTPQALAAWQDATNRHRNWPVVYTLTNTREVYVGETVNAAARMRQHLDAKEKQHLEEVRIILDDTFNKSACLDLESFLIRMFSGDGQLTVLNRNDGVTDANYFQRETYREQFEQIFEQLRTQGLFAKRIPEIVNSDLFKLSPFKALNADQEAVIEDILEGLFRDLEANADSTAVIQGGPGTGKTIVAIYLLKLIADIRARNDVDTGESDTPFSEFFTEGYPQVLAGARIGLVVPQQSLRASIKKVFKRTPGLSVDMVLTPYEVAKSPTPFDLLIVDETHRLTQYAAQAMGTLTKEYREISKRLARPGEDWEDLTQIDWIVRSSRHQIFLLDEGQSVRPADVPHAALEALRANARDSERRYRLRSQMRVAAGDDYLAFVRGLLSDKEPDAVAGFSGYDLRFFDRADAMYQAIREREAKHGLARLVAGYGWKWNSKGASEDEFVWDIEVDGLRLCWNRTAADWINSPTSIREVGSIHTVQGYDLNYAGVIIGPELYLDRVAGRICLNRDSYFDTKGKAANNLRGITYSDEDVLAMVKNAYNVLLTRGMRGTYVYVVDPALRAHLRRFFPRTVEG